MTERGTSPPFASIDEYRIIRPLGRGGMGQVYLAHDTFLDRPVALKFLVAADPSPSVRERFLVEARALARLSHPNVVTVYRVGVAEEQPFLVYEFVRGRTLDRLPRQLARAQLVELARGLARGLAAAHRRGVLHRDLKPANAILSDGGEVKLLDFGLAKFVDAGVEPDLAELETAHAGTEPTLEAGASVATLSVSDTGSQPAGRERAASVPGRGGPESLPPAALAAPSPQLTRDGVVMGTPYYIAPEIWAGQAATRRADIYSFGAVLFELASGGPPHRDIEVRDLREAVPARDAQRLADVAPGVNPRIGAIIDRCLHRDPAERFASADAIVDALEELTAARRVSIPDGNPYRGLAAFEAEHRELFFGRDTNVRVVLERLRTSGLVVVAGESGVGKSSLCRAGVLPLILDGALEPGRIWKAVTYVPGRHPLAALAHSLAHWLGPDERELARRLAADPDGVAAQLRAHQGDRYGLVLFLDQMEELVTVADPDEAEAIAQLLVRLASPSRAVRVLASVRGDFLVRVAHLAGLRDELPAALYLLAGLSVDGIRDAVVGPAAAKGVHFASEELVDRLCQTAAAPGGLPLLQFALAELWTAHDGAVITSGDLEAIGGVSAALTRHADNVLARLLPDQRAAAQRILTRLVTAEGTRAHKSSAELGLDGEAARGAASALVRERLLVAREDADGTAYEVAHEALIHEWATLRAWLHDDAHRAVVRQRLGVAVADWERLGRGRDALWSERQLTWAEGLESTELSQAERAFLAASRRMGRRRRQVRGGLILGTLLALAGVYVGVTYAEVRSRGARVTVRMAAARTALAEAEDQAAELASVRAQAFARFDDGVIDEAEATWTRSRALGLEADRSYQRASYEAETALMIDAARDDARALLADITLQRALLAERDRRTETVTELLQRLTLYDQDGARRTLWNAPGRLTLVTTPPGAHVTVARWVESAGERGRWEPYGPPLTAPVTDLLLDQGSYVFTCTAPAHAPVHYPVRVGRGEAYSAVVNLVPEASVPPGFVYVPAMRFLVGSTAEEGHRIGFEKASPLHESRIGEFLVAKNETTFADWLAYLRALPAPERAARSPRVSTVGMQGAIELEQLPTGTFQLTMQPGTQSFRAREGELVTYATRSRNGRQDWRRFPVTGISWEDATAYATWLRDSGRLPTARLCTEREWEVAARGADGRPFPTGDQLDPDEGNVHATYGDDLAAYGPDEVGTHPGGQSVYGIDDMAGNVFELNREVVARGGAFAFDRAAARIPVRNVVERGYRDVTVGFRLCADVFRVPPKL